MNDLECHRCRRSLRAGTPDPSARAIRRTRGNGLCPDCVLTYFLQNLDVLRRVWQEHGPEVLRLPHVQTHIATVLNRTQLTPGEIDYERVVANWNLPVSKEE